jgi:hypothetical protein
MNKPPTIRQVAAALGVSPTMAHKLVTQGMPIGEGVEACRRWREANVRTRPHRTRAAAAPADGETFAHWRMRREKALALDAEASLQERLGNLVRVDQLTAEFAHRCAVARDLLLGVASRLAPQCAGLDATTANRLLADEMHRAIDELANTMFGIQPKKGKVSD